MASTSYQANFLLHHCTPSWLEELRTEVNVLFKMMLNAIELFTDNPALTGKDFNRKRRKNPSHFFPDAKSVEVTLMELLTVVSRIKTLLPAPGSYDNPHKNTATGCMTTPYTQTKPKDSYVDFLSVINGMNSKSEPQVDKLSVTFSPEVNYLRQSTPKKPLKSISLASFSKIDGNSFTNADLSDELLWEMVKSVPKKKKKKESSKMKFTVRKSADTFASALRDGATRRNSAIQFNRDGDCEIVLGENELSIVSSRNSESCCSSDEEESEFDLSRYLSEIQRVRSKESVTVRSREFDRGVRRYFDFEDYYDRIMSHSEE